MNNFLQWAGAIPCGNTLAVINDAKLAKFHAVFDEKRQRAGKSTKG